MTSEKKLVTLTKYEYTCSVCGHVFLTDVYDGSEYGVLVFRGEHDDSLAVVDATQDPVFGRVSAFVKAQLPGMEANARSNVVWRLFSRTCDRDSGGGRFLLPLEPRCPACSSRARSHFRSLDRRTTVAVPMLGHQEWNALSEEEQQEALQRELAAPPT